MNNEIKILVEQVAQLAGNRFASLVYTSKETGEVARHTILIGFSYHNAVVKSLAELATLRFEDVSHGSRHADTDFTANDFADAKRAVGDSLQKTLDAHAIGEQNADYTKADVYVSLFNGLSVSKTDGSFKLFGLSINKVVLKNGIYKSVKSKPLTLAKNAIRRALPVGKFREYALDENTVAKAKLNGETIEM